MMLIVELVLGAMATAGTVLQNSEKKATSSHKKDLDGDLDPSELKYPENDEEGE